jgi:hypothetical protein
MFVTQRLPITRCPAPAWRSTRLAQRSTHLLGVWPLIDQVPHSQQQVDSSPVLKLLQQRFQLICSRQQWQRQQWQQQKSQEQSNRGAAAAAASAAAATRGIAQQPTIQKTVQPLR